MPTKPASGMKPYSAPGGGLSRLDTIIKPERGGLSNYDTLADGKSTAQRLPSPSTANDGPTPRLPKGGSIPGLQKTQIDGPIPMLYDPPNKTGRPGKATTAPRMGQKTQVPQGQPTQKPSRASPTTQLPSGDRGVSTMMDTTGGGATTHQAPLIATDGTQPSTMAPWDRPPLGSVPSNQWPADEHFFSSV